jgi:hypothetical protein
MHLPFHALRFLFIATFGVLLLARLHNREKRRLASSCPCVCVFFRMYELVSHWTVFRFGDFYENLTRKSKFD